jgi:D-amino-acid dehydrogenase
MAGRAWRFDKASYAKKLLPSLEVHEYTEWMGHRPCLPDSMQVIGRSPHFPSVYFAFGHGHLGLTGAPVTAELLTQLIQEQPLAFDISPFRIDRF